MRPEAPPQLQMRIEGKNPTLPATNSWLLGAADTMRVDNSTKSVGTAVHTISRCYARWMDVLVPVPIVIFPALYAMTWLSLVYPRKQNQTHHDAQSWNYKYSDMYSGYANNT